ncbi:MAG TPA: hypothetical protein VFR09_04235 [Alphaproteobacteria bacterium]|nr:hypothetical protein [Alphaproteobacteria bacterium]
MTVQGPSNQRFRSDAGIAIGPILFIIAILAILAAAIAAGSGSFTAGTSSETNRTKAAAIIQIGENLKVGMDRMMMENGIAYGAYTINTANTINNNDLFSPLGGGITIPSDSMANQTGTDHWLYPTGAVPSLGTNSPEQLAVLKVATGVCDEINTRANAIVTPVAADLGSFATTGSDIPIGNMNSWPLPGKPTGCVNNSNSTTAGTYYYQVLYIQ